jgi:hypothetical protein
MVRSGSERSGVESDSSPGGVEEETPPMYLFFFFFFVLRKEDRRPVLLLRSVHAHLTIVNPNRLITSRSVQSIFDGLDQE